MAVGDERALGALYDAYGQVAYALAHAMTGSAPSAEAVVSAAFADAWRSASTFNAARTSALAWLTAIVRRTALRSGRRANAPAGWDVPDHWLDCTTGGAFPEDHVVTRA